MSLKNLPPSFNADSEEDLRFAVALYFRDLGFDANELSFEDAFWIRLGHNTLIVKKDANRRDQVTGRSDLLLLRNGRPIAVVETKAPGNRLTDEDRWQVLSYARLLLEMAPFAIVTNGRDTEVYDTFSATLTPLQTPTESSWYVGGQQIPSIGRDLQFDAARMLIGIEPWTLRAFCSHQVAQAMADLRGTIYESKKFVPELYLARAEISKAFSDWLESDMPCFALVGKSGLGKTNFMCATIEELSKDFFVLFYPAMRLRDGLLGAVRNDFVWEFHRDRESSYIVDRFDAIAQQIGRKLIVFVDALEEFPGNVEVLKAELLDLVVRIRGRAVRLCVSCKAFDWDRFVIDKGQTYNQLAKSVYPARAPVHHAVALQSPQSQEVGIWLREFTDEELTQVFPKYGTQFSLQGQLRGMTRSECHTPLMLRLVAEVYSGRGVELPSELSSRELFDLYWERRLSETRSRAVGEIILCKAAELSVETGDRRVLLADLQDNVTWSDSTTAAFQDLIRLGMLLRERDNRGYEWVAFGLEKMRSYTYTVKARRWPLQDIEATGAQILRLLGNPLGVEAVEFYLASVDRGETSLLTRLALRDLTTFVELVCRLDLKTSVAETVPPEELPSVLSNRLEQYAIAYSDISRRYFPDLSERIEPYVTGPVGVWAHGSMFQLRTRTPVYPQPLVFLSDEVARMLWARTAPFELIKDLLPGGTIHIGMRDIANGNPHTFAWSRLRSQVGDLIASRLLDESSSPEILRERIWDTLMYEPSIWLEGTPLRRRNWQLLGIESTQAIQTTGIDDLMARTSGLLEQYNSLLPELAEKQSPAHRWYFLQTEALWQLYFWLDCLQQTGSELEPSPIVVEDMFKYLDQNDLTLAQAVLQPLIPGILRAYRSLVEHNFSRIGDRFTLSCHPDTSLLIEISWQHRGPGFSSDYLTLVFVLLPSVRLPEKYMVYCCPDEARSLRNIPYTRRTLKGTVIHHRASFGRAPISVQLGNLHIDEPNATLYVTRFPSRTPFLDQAYQLIGSEANFLLGYDCGSWPDVDLGRTNRVELNAWIRRYYFFPKTLRKVQNH